MEVLLADDQPQVRSALRLLLEQEPEIKVIGEVDNANDLLASAQSTKPDLLLLDWELPGMSNTDTVPALRRYCPCLAIVALSGHLEARKMALAAGVEGFVSKGHPPDELLNVLQKVRSKTVTKRIFVKDWMTGDLVTASPAMRLSEAYPLMIQNNIRRLPVLQDKHLIGIVTLGDIQEVVSTGNSVPPIFDESGNLSKLTVENVMTSEPVVVSQDSTVHEAALIMLQFKVGSLPVVDPENKLIGIITESDIFRMIVTQWKT